MAESPQTGKVAENNSTTTPLSAGATFTGVWEDVSGFGSITIAATADQSATLYADFSVDGITSDVANQLSDGDSGAMGFHALIPFRQYMRIRVVNGGTPQTSLRVQTIYNTGSRIAIPTGRLASALTPYTPVLNTRAALFGTLDDGETSASVGISSDGSLRTEITGPLAAFGDLLVSALTPVIQLDTTYGLTTTDFETFSASGGVASAANSLISAVTSTSVGSYAVIRSRRAMRYRAGQGIRARFTAMYTTGVALSLQMAGLFSATDGLMVGYSGTSFGFLRRIAGATAIHRLTVTTGTGGVENVIVTLNGVAFSFSSGGALSTTALAEFIAEQTAYTGWVSAVSPQSVGATVTFVQNTPAATSGAFTLTTDTGGGTLAGTFATVQAGAANDDATGFVAKTAWNVDRLDGTGGALNPSGELLDPTKLSVWEITQQHLGAGVIELRWESFSGRFHTVHRVEYPNTAVVPSQRSPVYRVGWIAASLGSTTALTVKGSSGAGFVEGAILPVRNPLTALAEVTASTTEYVALAIRARGEFGSTNNQRTLRPITLNAAIETSNRSVSVRVYVNPTMTGTVNWARVSATTSATDYATPSSIAPSGGELVAAFVVGSGSGLSLDLEKLDLRLAPGDVLAVSVDATTSTAATVIALNWWEI